MVGKRPQGSLNFARDRPARHIDLPISASGSRPCPGFAEARAAAERAGADAYLVGGAVRDALLGRPVANLDLVVEGDHVPLVEALGGERRAPRPLRHRHGPAHRAARSTSPAPAPRRYPRAGCAARGAPGRARRGPATARLHRQRDGGRARRPGRADRPARRPRRPARRDAAGAPRGLVRRRPDPGAARRPLRGAARASSPTPGRSSSCAPPTWRPSPTTASPPSSASSPRRSGRAAASSCSHEWGLLALAPGAGELIDRVCEVLARDPWEDVAARPAAVLAAVRGPGAAVEELARLEPTSASAAVAAARGRPGVELALARALGADWLDDYVDGGARCGSRSPATT